MGSQCVKYAELVKVFRLSVSIDSSLHWAADDVCKHFQGFPYSHDTSQPSKVSFAGMYLPLWANGL
jgi:hypothetical protein